MSRKIQMIIGIVICAAVWIGGVYYLYQSHKSGEVRVSGGVVTVSRPLDVDRHGNVLGPKSFVEAKAPQLVLLTLACGGVGLAFVIRAVAFNRPPQNP